jgi:hypothetical protein
VLPVKLQLSLWILFELETGMWVDETLCLFVMQVRHCLFKASVLPTMQEQEDASGLVALESLRSFKRPDPPCDIGPLPSKRRKSSSLHAIRENVLTSNPPSFQRSFSETEATIKRALLRCEYLSLSWTQMFSSFDLYCGILHIKVCLKNGVFWDVTLCGSCKNRRFGGT